MPDSRTSDALIRSFMLGTARQPVPAEAIASGGGSVLGALAMLSQELRFRRPPDIAAPGPVDLAPAETRPFVPDAAREPLRRLLGRGGKFEDVVAEAIADVLLDAGLSLHPFDRPYLPDFIRRFGGWSRGADSVWAIYEGWSPDGVPWAKLSGVDKAARLQVLRMQDIAAGRAHLEAVLAQESPATRVLLVRALEPLLEAGDRPFLESLAKDRAPSVREAADAVLARLPGTPQADRALEGLLARLRKNPATWRLEGFDWVPLDTLAAGLGITIEEMVSGAKARFAAKALLARASVERRFDLVERLARDDPLSWISVAGSQDMLLAGREVARDWSDAAIQPEHWPVMIDFGALGALRRTMRGRLPLAVAQRLLDAPVWISSLEIRPEDTPWALAGTICAVACLVPAPLRPVLRSQIAALPEWHTTRALATLDLFDIIESAPESP